MKALLIVAAVVLIPGGIIFKVQRAKAARENAAFAAYQHFADSWYKSRIADMRSNSEGAKMTAVVDAREKDYFALVKAGILNEVHPNDVTITYERGGLTISGDTADLIGIQWTKPATSGMVIDQRKIPLKSWRHAVTMHLVNDKWMITGFEESEMK